MEIQTVLKKQKPMIIPGKRSHRQLNERQSINVQSILHGGRIQPKLRVGQPNDKYEQEADRVADQVMRMPSLQTSQENERSSRVPNIVPSNIQRKCAGCEEQELLQTKRMVEGKTANEPDADTAAQINAIRTGGKPLPDAERAFFEPRFGADLSQVRIHNDRQSAVSAKALNARAYTLGRDVVFDSGEYRPDTFDGRQLLAHELTHTIQQAGDSVNSGHTIQRQPACGTSTPETTVDVFIVELPGSSRNATTDVATADTIWKECGVRVNMVGGESMQTNLLDIDVPHGVLNAPSSTTRPLTTEETEMLSNQPGGSAIHAYYVPDFSGPKVGEAFWPSFHGISAFAINNSALTEVFAHELGHVMLDSGGHEPNGSNVMARNIQSIGGHDLECRQCP